MVKSATMSSKITVARPLILLFLLITAGFFLTTQAYAVLPQSSNVVGLWHLDESSGYTASDSSGMGKTITANGGIQLTTSTYEFGTASCSLDGTSGYLDIADSDDWHFGTGDFTVDFWVNFNDVTTGQETLFSGDTGGEHFQVQWQGGSSNHWQVIVNGASNGGPGGSTNSYQNFSDTLSSHTWYHIAIVKSSNTIRVFRNGTQVGSDWTDTSSIDMNGIRIGASASPGYFLYGYIANGIPNIEIVIVLLRSTIQARI